MTFKHYYNNTDKTRKQVLGDKKLIVSLTSFPARINFVHIPITDILSSSFKPDLVVLYLAQTQFNNKMVDMPDTLLSLTKSDPRFCIRFVPDDTRSFKKLIPALKEFCNDFIYTVDDDVRYKKHAIRKTMARAALYPNTIIAGCARHLFLDSEGNPKHYNSLKLSQWPNYLRLGNIPRFSNILKGSAGVLYPPNSLHQDVTNEDLFLELCPTVDDIWFWAMAVANGTKIALSSCYWLSHKVRAAQSVSLWNINKHAADGQQFLTPNDIAIKTLIKKYPIIIDKLRQE